MLFDLWYPTILSCIVKCKSEEEYTIRDYDIHSFHVIDIVLIHVLYGSSFIFCNFR